jgi:HlyD family secretion protein
MNRRWILVLTGFVAAVAATVLITKQVTGSSAGSSTPLRAGSAAQAEIKNPPAVAAATTRPASDQGSQVFTLPASLVPEETVELYAKASGYVAEINVDIGSRVRKGDILVLLKAPELLDDLRANEALVTARQAKMAAMQAKTDQARLAIESAQAELKRVEAELNLCRITHGRKADLYREKAIPQQEYDVAQNQLAVTEADLAIAKAKVESAKGEQLAAEADVKAAEAEIAVAQADQARLKTLIEYMTVKAPFDGVIARRGVDHGAFVRSAAQAAGLPLLAIDRVGVRLVIDVPETQASLVHIGTEVRIQVRANGDRPVTARVARTAVSLRSDTRTMRAEIDLENKDGKLMPGMYARASIPLQPTAQVLAGGR